MSQGETKANESPETNENGNQTWQAIPDTGRKMLKEGL